MPTIEFKKPKVRIRTLYQTSGAVADITINVANITSHINMSHIAPPTPPPTGKIIFFADGTDNVLKARKADGSIVNLENPGFAPHNLLDGSVHPDTSPTTVSRGTLIAGRLVGGVTKWAGLAIGATGNVLKSDGVDVIWGNVDWGEVINKPSTFPPSSHTHPLSEVTDTNIGRIPFTGATNTLTNDANLFWDNTNKRLGLGTGTPQEKFTISSDSNIAVNMATPTGVTGIATTGGTLSAGTYYIRVVASDGVGTTAGSAEIAVTVAPPTTNAIQVSWGSVTGAVSYRVYAGTSSGGQDRYWTTTATSFTITAFGAGDGSTAGTVPTVTTAYINKLAASGNSWLLGDNLGVGTAGPASLLELYKTDVSPILTITSATAATTYDPYIAFRTGATPSTQAVIGIDYSDSNKLKLVRGSDISVSTGITIDSSGNLGVGTTTSGAKLHIVGGSTGETAAIESPRTDGSITFINIPEVLNNWADIRFSTAIARSSLNNFAAIRALITQSDPSALKGELRLFTNAGDLLTEKMRITSSGDVSIGGIDPSKVTAGTVLHISNSNGVELRLQRSVAFSIIDDGGRWELRPISQAPQTGIVFRDDGRIGIGMDASNIGTGNKLGITGNVYISGSLGIKTTSPSGDLQVGSTTSSQALINLTTSTTGTGDIFFNDTVSNRGVIRYAHSTDDMTLWTAGIERVKINSSGNVGIGTTGPGQQLTVRASQYFDTVFYYDGATYYDRTTEAKTSGGTAYIVLADAIDDLFYVGKTTTFNKIYFDLSTVGAGLTLVAEYWNGAAWVTLTITDGTANLTQDGTISFTIPADWAQTTVNGVNRYWARLKTTTAPTTTPTAYITVPDDTDRVGVYAQQGDSTPTFYINKKGEVGIGTTPAAKLHVSGDTRVDRLYIKSAVGAGAPRHQGYLYLLANPAPTTGTNEIWLMIGNDNIGIDVTGQSGNVRKVSFAGETLTATSPTTIPQAVGLLVGSLGAGANVTITQSAAIYAQGNMWVDGNLGVGTTSPGYKLDVNGTGNFQGNVRLFAGATSYGLLQLSGTRLLLLSNGYIDSSGQAMDIRAASGYPIQFKISTAEYARVHSDGNFGIRQASPNSPLHVGGSIATAVTTQTANYTVSATDSVVIGNPSAANITFTLPTAVGITGRRYTFKNKSSTYNVVIDAAGTETIDGALTKTLGANAALEIISDGANWIIISAYGSVT